MKNIGLLRSPAQMLVGLLLLGATVFGGVLGSFDPAFRPSVPLKVTSLLPLPDGKIIVGGSFSNALQQIPWGVNRLNADGTLDRTFAAPMQPGGWTAVSALALQVDQKIVVSGFFSGYSNGVYRLLPDGSFDPAFHQAASLAGGAVSAVALQGDGKIVFTEIQTNGVMASRLVRLNPDGALDPTFKPASDGRVMAVQPDGRILITRIGPSPLIRLLPDGSEDSSFASEACPTLCGIDALAVQPDGRILVGGASNSGTSVVRLGADGSLDSTFKPFVLFQSGVEALALQADGHILIAGVLPFDPFFPLSLARLGPNGTRDPAFKVLATDGTPGTVALDANGDILIGGDFQLINGFPQPYLARLFGSGAADPFGDPVILVSPSDQNIVAGNPASFTVTATSTLPLGYQWFRGGGMLSGETNSTLIIPDVELGDDGFYYQVLVYNAVGFTTSSMATLRVNFAAPLSAVVDPPSQQVAQGSETQFTARANGGTPPFSYQWFVKGQPIVGATSAQFTIANTQPDDGGTYEVHVSDASRTVVVSQSALFVTPIVGEFDPSFMLQSAQPPGFGNFYGTMLVQPDDRVVLVEFLAVGGGGAFGGIGALCQLRRFNSDGTADPSLQFSYRDDYLTLLSLGIQHSGKLLIGGNFYANPAKSMPAGIARLNPDGSVDTSFKVGAGVSGSDTHETVFAISVLPDDSVMLAGSFSSINGVPRVSLARLNPDGSVDPRFDAGLVTDLSLQCVAVQPDGKILVGGTFDHFGGVATLGIARLNPDGTVDSGFIHPGLRTALRKMKSAGNLPPPADSYSISALALQSDGKILIGGQWSGLPDSAQRGLVARLNPDGTPDPQFVVLTIDRPGGDRVSSFLVLPSGKIMVGGTFHAGPGGELDGMARLFPDGSVDHSLVPYKSPLDWRIYPPTFGLQKDGSVVVDASATLYRLKPEPAATRPPQIASLAVATDGAISFKLVQPLLQAVTVEASVDLHAWSAVYSNSVPAASLEFPDPKAQNESTRFYRLRIDAAQAH